MGQLASQCQQPKKAACSNTATNPSTNRNPPTHVENGREEQHRDGTWSDYEVVKNDSIIVPSTRLPWIIFLAVAHIKELRTTSRHAGTKTLVGM
jgi:hypothetical protein